MSAPMNIQHRRTPSTTYYAPQPTHARSVSSQFGTSWSDGFEFTSCSPLNSALHFETSPHMSNAYLPSSYVPLSMSCSPRGDYFTFERNYCSNFACCGITLPDMHALVAHFEETHLGGADGMFMPHHHGLGQRTGVPMPQAKPVPQIYTNDNTGMNLVPGTATGDTPSPHSSVGPETPPPASHVPGYGFPSTGQPQLQVQTQIYGSRANSASPYPHSPFSAHSPYAASPLSAGSPASSGSYEYRSECAGSQSSTSSQELEMDMDIDMDVLMSFDPLDNGVHTSLDSTPPSPLAPPIRPSSVLRAAALKNNGGQPDAPPVGFPPSLFSAPVPTPSPLGLSSSSEKDGKERKEKKERREKEKKSRAASPVIVVGESTTSGGSTSAIGAVRREKNRKASSTMSSLLGLGASSRSSMSSSDEGSVTGEGASAEKEREELREEKAAKPQRHERAERTGRPERVDKSGKRTREKAYKCPKPGCTKSYLNPNGLKYHAAKGTCTFANGSAPPTPVTPTTPGIPSISIPLAPPMSTVQSTSDASNVPILSQPMTPTVSQKTFAMIDAFRLL